jgi:drug/metabolite transporter (DMT)-like permease
VNTAALGLAVGSTFAHAGWNLLTRGQQDRETLMQRMLIVVAVVGVIPMIIGEWMCPQMTVTAWWCAGVAGFFGGMYYFFLAHSYNKADFTTAYPVIRALPIILIAVVDILRGRSIPFVGWIAISLVAFGCLLSTLTSFREFSLKRFFHHSFALILIAAAGTVGYTIFDKLAQESIRLTAEASLAPDAAVPAMTAIGGVAKYQWAMLTAALVAFLGFQRAFPGHRRALRAQPGCSGPGWGAPAAVAGMVFLGYGMILWAFQIEPHASYITAVRQFSIVLGVVLAFAIFHEKGFLVRTTGVSLIVMGMVLIATLPEATSDSSINADVAPAAMVAPAE